jgi:hypothetical protein
MRADGVPIRLAKVDDSSVTTCAKAFITGIKGDCASINIPAADVFGTGILY